MLKKLWAENDKLVEGRKNKKAIPGAPEENDKSLTEIEEMSNEGNQN